ncbi:hypothetical protein ABTE31_21575, partial [Acinetobacter baumannii]
GADRRLSIDLRRADIPTVPRPPNFFTQGTTTAPVPWATVACQPGTIKAEHAFRTELRAPEKAYRPVNQARTNGSP